MSLDVSLIRVGRAPWGIMSMSRSDPSYTVEESEDSLVITIPSCRDWFKALYHTAMTMVGIPAVLLVACGLSSAVQSEMTGMIWLSAFGLVACLLGLCQGVLGLMWQSDGKEIIHIREYEITYQRQSHGLSRKRNYRTEHTISLQSEPWKKWPYGQYRRRVPQNILQGQSWGIVTLDIDGKTHRFGSEIGEAEAEAIVRRIGEKFPRYETDQGVLNGQ